MSMIYRMISKHILNSNVDELVKSQQIACFVIPAKAGHAVKPLRYPVISMSSGCRIIKACPGPRSRGRHDGWETFFERIKIEPKHLSDDNPEKVFQLIQKIFSEEGQRPSERLGRVIYDHWLNVTQFPRIIMIVLEHSICLFPL